MINLPTQSQQTLCLDVMGRLLKEKFGHEAGESDRFPLAAQTIEDRYLLQIAMDQPARHDIELAFHQINPSAATCSGIRQ